MRQTASHNRERLTVDLKTREQAAYEALRQAVILGRWQPGESLVISRIALDLGMSRIPVTNAVKQLAGEGFVRMRPYQEAVVAPFNARDIREIYLMRATLESLAAAEGLAKVSMENLNDVRALNEELRRVSYTPDTALENAREIDKVFHKKIRGIADMPHLAQTLENLADQCEYYRVCLLDQRHFAPPTAERHEPIIEALEACDVDQLQSLMKTHVLEGMHLVLGALNVSQ